MAHIKKGRIQIVAKTGGILFEGEEDIWYNPIDSCKQYVKKDFQGNLVEITLTEENGRYFSYIKKAEGESGSSEVIGNISEEPKRRYRAMAISYAKDLIVEGKIEMNQFRTVSSKIFDYIWEGKIE